MEFCSTFSSDELAAATGGSWRSSPDGKLAVATDNRCCCRGKIFVALRGERFDGHNFLAEAVNSNAAALLVDRKYAGPLPDNIPVLSVSDTTLAYQ